MTQVCCVYSQLLQLFPRGQFNQAVKQHQAEFSAKGFTYWEQFVAMLFCQVAHLNVSSGQVHSFAGFGR